MKRTAWLAILGAAGLALSAACLILPHPGEAEGWRRIPERDRTETGRTEPRRTEERAPARSGGGTEFRRAVPLRAGSSLTLENDYGNVEITGWDRDEVDVVAAAGAGGDRTSSYRRPAPDVEVRETGRGVLVRTRTFEGEGTPPAVGYRIRAPQSVVLAGLRLSEGDLRVSDIFGRLEASVDQGNLKVENFSGAIDVTVGAGAADVEVLDLREEDSIIITCRRGDIVLRLEAGAGAIVEADAPRGLVRSEFDLGRTLPAPTVKGWIGQGGPNIVLRAPNGRIEIVKAK
ncbi:MAG: hypothetical protein GX465_13460 [Acidobacteria bacterium]|nr:hypothetical protein [Acidobacteriota bacterium]